jgi:hypothetical protein
MEQDNRINIIIEAREKLSALGKATALLEKLRKEGKISKSVYEQGLASINEQIAATVEMERTARKELTQTAKTKAKTDKKGTADSKKNLKTIADAVSSFSVTLPLLFGFQQLSQGIGNLLDPAMQLLGVNQLQQQFLAIKYLPTAKKQLDKVLEMGDAIDNTSDDQRGAEGEMLLLVKQMSDVISYASQMAMSFAAIGEAFPLIGRSAGAALGAATGLAAAFLTLGSDEGQVISYFEGMDAAVALTATDLAGNMMNALDKFRPQIVDTKEEVDQLVQQLDKVSGDYIAKISVDLYLNNPQLWEYLQREAEKAGKGQYLPTPATVATKAAETTPIVAHAATPPLKELNKEIESKGGKIIKPQTITKSVKDWLFNLIKWSPTPNPLMFASGGIVPGSSNQAVPIIAHGGETILPAGQGINIVFNINATISNDYDVRKLATELNKYWTSDFERISKARGMI